MSTAIRELPDVETLIVKHLQADQDLVTAGVKQIAGPESPKQPKWPMVRIHRTGGSAPVAFWLDGAFIQVDVWGVKDTAQLRRITSKVWVSLQRMIGVHTLGVVTGVEETVGRVYLPDPGTDRPRYLFGIRVFAHPNP